MDLLWDARTKLQLSGDVEMKSSGLMQLLRDADPSFDPLEKDGFRAANNNGYLVDLIRPAPRPPWKMEPKRLAPADELVAAEIENLEWLESSPRFSRIVVGEDGVPARMVTPDPRAFCLYKLWLSEQPRREAFKRQRDRQQAIAVAKLVAERLPQLPFTSEHLKAFPKDVIDAGKKRLIAEGIEWTDSAS